MDQKHSGTLNRRDMLRLSGGAIVAGAAALKGTSAAAAPQMGSTLQPCTTGGPLYTEVYPTSPFILEPFSQDLPNPVPMQPSNPAFWSDLGAYQWARPDCRTGGRQDCDFARHQVGYEAIPTGLKGKSAYLAYPEPLYYRLAMQVGQHQFTTSKVKPIQANGRPVFEGLPGYGQVHLPPSTIYGFSTTPHIPNSAAFPGAMIYARYGQPVALRIENQLDIDGGLDRMDFGSPEWGFLTHLHNGHTACESDGNPNWRDQGYIPGQWCDNLYLNFPPGNDPGEKQSFLWFHDHYHSHTGANVYKGMVGLFPLYDPQLDPGDERLGLHLPGVPNPITGRVDYDIPLAFFDVAIDDGVTGHRDAHNGCGESHPEWWGKHYFRHLPNHGFVGDVFTTNCVAYPVLKVKRRKYRFRLLGASIARIYDFSFVTDTQGPVPAGLDADGITAFKNGSLDFATANWDTNPKKRQGQWRLKQPQLCMNFHEIATDGGLLPYPIQRSSVEIWPAKRRELILDFSRYIDGTPTTDGDVIYLANTYQMTNGRKRTDKMRVKLDALGNEILPLQFEPNPDFEEGFCVPMMKIIIEGNDMPQDDSVVPSSLRPLPRIDTRRIDGLIERHFRLHRGGTFGGENEWLINDEIFHHGHNLAFPKMGVPEIWTIENGGGGWVHPMHFHYEEHRTISRNGVPTGLDPKHPDDNSREDVIALEPGEVVKIYRNFRTFHGPYVAHCHNLAHEDHSMMFGFEVTP